MTTWIIEPHDSLIVRDGRPFGADPGARATSLSFPFPSTTTGGARTRAGLNTEGIFDLDSQQLDALKKVRVRGPLLVQLANEGHDIEEGKWLVPTPSDVLLLEGTTTSDDRTTLLRQLVPLRLPEDAQTDFDRKSQECPWLVGQSLDHYDKEKPMKNGLSFWYWEKFQTWLLDPAQLCNKEIPLATLGLERLQRDRRLHVSIDSDKGVARDGKFFETSGLEFTLPGRGEHRLHDARRLALAVAVDDDPPENHDGFALRAGLAGFAGERRIVAWRKSSMNLPLCPDELVQDLIINKGCRIILLTPACFEKGYHPTWLLKESASKHGVTAQLKAIAIQRPQVVSGWDFAIKKPKPSRRLAPAGTVLFLSLEGSDDAIRQWVRDIWMHCISDDEQDRRDGFGLAVAGTWSQSGKEGDV